MDELLSLIRSGKLLSEEAVERLTVAIFEAEVREKADIRERESVSREREAVSREREAVSREREAVSRERVAKIKADADIAIAKINSSKNKVRF